MPPKNRFQFFFGEIDISDKFFCIQMKHRTDDFVGSISIWTFSEKGRKVTRRDLKRTSLWSGERFLDTWAKNGAFNMVGQPTVFNFSS